MREPRREGLAVIGCGTIGRIRAMLARDYPGIGWIGLCDINTEIGERLKRDCDALREGVPIPPALCEKLDQLAEMLAIRPLSVVQ